MSRDDVCFHLSYQKLLRLYGFEEPDKALTYPCTGFVPYTPVTPTYSATTVEAVTVTSPTSGNETITTATAQPTTVPVPASSDNIVTELTQTSQSVTIFNSTTFTPLIAQTITGSQITEETGSTTLEKNTYGQTEVDEQTRITTNEIEETSPDITAAFSNTVTSTNNDDKSNTDYTTSANIQMAESNIKEQKVVKNTAQKSQTSKIATTTASTLPNTLAVPSNNVSKANVTQYGKQSTSKSTTQSSKQNSTKNTTQPGKQNSTKTTIQPAKQNSTKNTAQPSKQNSTKNTTQSSKQNSTTTTTQPNKPNSTKNNQTKTAEDSAVDSEKKNFTTDLETDFKFPTGDFFDNETSDESDFVDDTLFELKSNVSLLDRYNITKELKLPTLKPSFNLSFSNSPQLSTKDKDFNFNNSSTFYSTLVNFIENATQKIKDFVTFDESERTTESSVKNKNIPFAVKPQTVSKNGPNSTSTNTAKKTTNVTSSKNMTSAPTLLSNEKNINTSKTIAAEATDPRNLPKKSISASNEKENVAAAVSLTPTIMKSPSNYYNILSLRHSKSVSSKFDIKGVRRQKRHIKRHAPVREFKPRDLNANSKNFNQSLTTMTKLGSNFNYTSEIKRGLNATRSKMPKSMKVIEDYDAYLPPILTAAENVGLDYRKIRSFGREYSS